MFRPLSGFKTQYHYLALVVAADFDEWRVVARGPSFTLQGQRQFSEARAKAHARLMAASYIHDEKHEDLPVIEEPEWTPLVPGDWMDFRP
ncbi:MAG: hypothetical protein ABSC23_20885 [Bryobacteraceae bacterium]